MKYNEALRLKVGDVVSIKTYGFCVFRIEEMSVEENRVLFCLMAIGQYLAIKCDNTTIEKKLSEV